MGSHVIVQVLFGGNELEADVALVLGGQGRLLVRLVGQGGRLARGPQHLVVLHHGRAQVL